MKGIPHDKKIILFDGVCNLCDSWVQYVIKHDKNDVFRFVSLQSELGKNILKHLGLSTHYIYTIVLYVPGKAYYLKSNAALEIAKGMGGFFHFGTIFRIFPSFLRDLVYDLISKNRYKWFGKQESCMIPTAELKSKFLE